MKKQYLIQIIGLIAVLFFTIIFVLFINGQSLNKESPETFNNVPHSTSSYLKSEEAVLLPDSSNHTGTTTIIPIEPLLFEYVVVVDGCGIHFEGECLNVRAGPGTEYPVQYRLRNGIVLKIDGGVERDGVTWYRVVFDEWLRYPERITGDWYVHEDYVSVLYDEGDKTVWDDGATASVLKRIIVDRSDQTLKAFEDDVMVFDTPISTGLELTPTPRGTFTIFKKTPSRYMQGPLPGLADRQIYDLPGVPWNLYFTHGGAVIHGSYWHDSFGSQYSHGCVNVPLDVAREIYNWAELGTTVIVQD